MGAPILGGQTIPRPNEYSETPIRQGSYTKTLDGTTRRAVHSDKHSYTLTFTSISPENMSMLRAIYSLKDTVSFIWDEVGVTATVHVDIGDIRVRSGDPSLKSSVTVTLTEA